MKRELINFDIYPKVVPCGKPVTITIRCINKKSLFEKNKDYYIRFNVMTEGNHGTYPHRPNYARYVERLSDDGCFHVTHTFDIEAENYVRIGDDDVWSYAQLSVYAVKEDLVGRYPYMGDLHMHSTRSDGKDDPEIVAAHYRQFGYDFMTLTDHKRYYPSLELDDFYKDLHLDFKMYPGEEIHLPGNDVHLINFGGDYSVNGLWDASMQCQDRGPGKEHRSKYGVCPDTVSEEEYRRQVNELAETLHLPDYIEKFQYASCVWAFNHIRKGNGLAILAHPYWINNVYQVPDDFLDYMLEQKPFDAFEIMSGCDYFQQNGMQIQKYHDVQRRGVTIPIVGSTDSHESNEHNPISHSARTIVLCKENTRDAIRDAVKELYNVALQDIHGHQEVLGTFRMMRYCWFLYEEYFPLHDEMCYEEGRLMREYACGNAGAGEELKRMEHRMDDFRKKYFAF